jgi:hypothetical protein
MPASSKPRPPHGGHDEGVTLEFGALVEGLHGWVPDDRGRGRSRRGAGRPAKLPAKRGKRDRPARIYQIKVGIRRATPPIWRRLELSADTSLAGLHGILQVAFGWDDAHMHVFRTSYGEFGVADAELGYRAEAPVTLEQVAPAVGDKIGYIYDFGDDWDLEIVVEKQHTATANSDRAGYPRCIGGRRAAPPEDSGGIGAYSHLVAALADADHPDHINVIDWLDMAHAQPDFDPAYFDPGAVNHALSRLR